MAAHDMCPLLTHSPSVSSKGTLMLPFHQKPCQTRRIKHSLRTERGRSKERRRENRVETVTLGGGLIGEFFPKCSTTFCFFEKDSAFLNIYIYIYMFVCLFLYMLGLHCCAGFSLVAASGGYSPCDTQASRCGASSCC